MLNLLLLIGTLAIFGAGYLLWKFGLKDGDRLPASPARRREDARDWQRRFGVESLLAANFLQPTQNEILETLSVLDHLTPGWEAGDGVSSERHFLNELALNFPSLCKPACTYPLPFAETFEVNDLSPAAARAKQPATEQEIAARRETFRAGRAQTNAMEQFIAGPAVGPATVTPGSLPFRALADGPILHAGNPWPNRFAGAAAVIAVLLGATYFYDHTAFLKTAPDSPAQISTAPVAIAADPAPTTPEVLETVTEALPAPTAEPVIAAKPALLPSHPSPVKPSPEKVALNSQIAASKQRAVGKYPALAVEGSEINLRFVFRYKNLVQQNSPRLLDPVWPEELAEECATAAGMSSKHGTLTQVAGSHR